MTERTEHPSVSRVRLRLLESGIETEIRHLDESASTAVAAAAALDVEVGQIASSIVFKIETENGVQPVLVVTSGRHRVDTKLVAHSASLPKLGRADADFVRNWSGFAIGGVSPVGWIHNGVAFQPITIVDTALKEYPILWAACGLHDAVCSLTYSDIIALTSGTELEVAVD
jgi:prolyl-tRNA editing enzyme YbaK/EbsC (Cys-tRNA(Pro) deacylase)